MESTYGVPESAGSFGSPHLVSKYSKAKLDDVKSWLAGQNSYTLHRSARRRFRRRKTYAVGIDHLWQADLVDVTLISRHNDNYKFTLTCIDCFSRYAFAVPVKNKSAIEVRNSFTNILRSSERRPVYLQTDKGTEFLNAVFLSFLKEEDILHYTSENDDIKCSVVERFNRTLKSKMWRYFTHNKTLRFLDALPRLLTSYNATYHTTIKMAPIEVTRHNEADLHDLLYGKGNSSAKRYKLELKDTVRISRNVHKFHKGYEGVWSKEVFRVKNRFPTDPPTYELEDYSGEEVKGKFYEQELQKVNTDPSVFEVERVLKTRKNKGKLQYLVRWSGYGPKHDSWVDEIL